MILRQSLNFAVHFTAGLVFGALAVAVASRCRRQDSRKEDDWSPPPRPATPPEPYPTTTDE